MKQLCVALLFVGAIVLNVASGDVIMKRMATDKLLMHKLTSARAGNPDYTLPCFTLYLPIYQDILDEYSASYQKCNTDANSEIKVLNDEAAANRSQITQGAQDVCNSMTTCSALDETLDFLDCYSNVGGENVKTLYTLTSNATEVAANLREQYRVITNEMEKCQNASSRAYVEGNAAVTEALDSCLENGPPEVVTTTTEEPVEETTPAEASTPVEPEESINSIAQNDEVISTAQIAKLKRTNRLVRNNRLKP